VRGGGRLYIQVAPTRADLHITRATHETDYPLELIQEILRVKGPAWICDEIARDEDPNYVQRHITFDLLSYVPAEWFKGKRVLDFGSGCGASTVVMARMLPGAEFVGVELLEEYTGVARRRAELLGYRNAQFLTSPDPNSLPANVGEFDAIVLSAVWEHLLPGERPQLLNRLWARMKPGGIIFINQTPHRLWPIEAHTTGIPLLNYVPSAVALPVAKKLSPRVAPEHSWSDLLRKGIRGGTVHEIMGHLKKSGHRATLLSPTAAGMRDRIDLWYQTSSELGKGGVKRVMRTGLKTLRAVSGQTLVPALSIAIRKD